MDYKPSVQPDSPYKGGTFYFKLALPEDFPFKAPTVWHFVERCHKALIRVGAS